MKITKIFFLFLFIIALSGKSQSYINYVLGKYFGTVYINGCPSAGTSQGALYLIPDPNYNFTVYAEDSSAFGYLGEPWHIIVNADSTLRRYVGGQDSVVYGKLYANDSIQLHVVIFGNPVCYREFNGFKLYSTVGVNDLNKQENDLLISPQPANDIMHIQSTQLVFRQEDIPIIYDISGKQHIIPMQYINKNTYKLDVNSLSAGMYVIAIKTEKGIVRRKMIVQ